MKKHLILFCLSCSLCFFKAQQPYIGTTTVIPQNPTANDYIKVVTHVTTPNQGIIVDQSFTITGQQINLLGCYWQGMLTAIQNHIDTFFIGQLSPGTYQINHQTYISTTQQWCNKVDSNSASSSFVVSGFTGIRNHVSQKELRLCPNPASSVLFIDGVIPAGGVQILNSKGTLVRQTRELEAESIDISGLQEGLYLIRFQNNSEVRTARFVKCSF